MRSRLWLCLVSVLVLGCGGNKVDPPKQKLDAPTNVKGVGMGSGESGGLPKPPDAGPPK